MILRGRAVRSSACLLAMRSCRSGTSILRHAPRRGPRLLHCTTATPPDLTGHASPPFPATALKAACILPVPLPDGAQDLPFYSQYPLDRKAEWRSDADKLHALFMHPAASLVLLSRDKCLVTRAVDGDSTSSSSSSNNGNGSSAADSTVKWRLLMLQPASAAHTVLLAPAAAAAGEGRAATADVGREGQQTSEAVASSNGNGSTEPDTRAALFLGVDSTGAPVFAWDVTDDQADPVLRAASSSPLLSLPSPPKWRATRSLELSAEEGALAATAVGLAQWNRVALFKSSSGEALRPSNGGFARRSPGSKGSVWPRIDPAVIMLTTAGAHDEWCLMGRKPEWPEGRYSTLAGFVEVGEPLEMAVAREVEEESGVPVRLSSVRYVISQPWPFPRSLMIGFYAQARLADAPTGLRGYDLLGRDGRGAAIDTGLTQEEVEEALLPALPPARPQEDEMADVRWFHRDFVRAALEAGGTWTAASSSGAPGTVLDSVLGGSSLLQGARGFAIPGGFHRNCLRAVLEAGRTWTAASSSSGSSSGGTSSVLDSVLGGSSVLHGARGLTIAGHYSLANRLIRGWLAGASARDVGPALSLSSENDTASAAGAASLWPGDLIPQVELDVGVFKYVLMRLSDESSGRSKLLVWGDTRAAYHMNIVQAAKSRIRRLGLDLDIQPLGGGRISHQLPPPPPKPTPPSSSDSPPGGKPPRAPAAGPLQPGACHIYGFSSAFGPAPHEVAAALVRRWHPFTVVTTSYEGY